MKTANNSGHHIVSKDVIRAMAVQAEWMDGY